MTRRLDIADVCFLCQRRACGLGVGGHGNRPKVGWLCEDCADGLYGQRAYAMTARQFDEYERRALLRAGDEAGAYLDRVGRTDLATLGAEDWRVFLGIVVTSFGRFVREEVGRGAVQGWAPEALPAHRGPDDDEREDAA